ncbi:MAG: ABC transporter ATP-binding protein [Candidatus Heimdallarchaeota archaeon]
MKTSTPDSINTYYYKEFSLEVDPFEKARQKGPISWIIAHIFHRSNKLIVLFTFFTTIATATISSEIMILLGKAIDEFTAGFATNLRHYTILLLILAVGSPVLSVINTLIREVLAQRMERDTRHEFFVNLIGKSQSFHEHQRIGDIMARTTNDVRMLNFLISPALSLIFESVTGLVVPILFIYILYPSSLLITPLLFILGFVIALGNYNRQLNPVTTQLRAEFGQMNASLNETLSGIEVVKGSAQEVAEMNKFYSHTKAYRDAFVKQGEIQAKYIPLLLIAVTVTVGLAHGIYWNLQGLLEIGQVIAYVGLLANLRFPTFISIWTFAVVRLAISGSERLLEVMNKETEIDENVTGVTKQIDGAIKFENVTFTYPGASKPVLRNISFEVKPGQTVALVGTAGSGKTTLTKLLSRLYDVNKGQVLIDGIDVREYSLQSLRPQISYIEQDVFLFSTTVFENISFGRSSSQEEAIAVAKEAQAHEFISALPKGYESEVGERGVQLSGGERQRIAIARAFLTTPRILILDDSTSAIDTETENKIQQAIRQILQDRTTILITHRLSQIRWADLILVLKRGEIVAQGTHEELLRTSEEYQKIFVKRFDVDVAQLLAGVD